MKRTCWLFFAALLFAVPPASEAADPKTFPADHPFLELLTASKIERGREHRALLVVPISADLETPKQTPRPMTSAEAHRGQHLSAGEPEGKEGRLRIDLYNWSTNPILLIAGESLEGGYRDRFLARDVLVPPGKKTEAPVFPADGRKRDRNARKKSLAPSDALAPSYPRFNTVFASLAAPVLVFLDNACTLTNVPDPRKPFSAVLGSPKLAARSTDYRTVFSKIPSEAEGRVIGIAAWVGDRLVGIDIFGSNADLRAHWPKLIRSLALEAALYELANGLIAHPFPAGRDPERHRAELKGLLRKPYAARVYKRVPIGMGTESRFVRDGLVGRLLLFEERVVHAVLMVDVRNPLTASAPPTTGPPPETTYEELIRKASRSRLTEYERRLLERMRQRRRKLPDRTPPRQPDTPVVPVPPRDDG